MSYPIDTFEVEGGITKQTGYRIPPEPKDMFETVGFPSPWEDQPEELKIQYRENHINALMAMAVYFIFWGIILVFTVGRYPADYVYWTIQLITILWIIGGSIFMWYIWLHGRPEMAIGLGVIFIVVYALIVYFVLEKRYQDVYLAHPFMIRP